MDAESDTKANIDSDHYPRTADLRMKLKAIKSKQKNRPKYDKCDELRREQLNTTLHAAGEYTDDTTYLKQVQGIVRDNLPRKNERAHNAIFSERSAGILEERATAMAEGRAGDFITLNKEYRKSRTKDKRDYAISTLSQDLGTRDIWMGIRQLKSTYAPQPYHRKDSGGKHIRYRKRAQSI